MLANQINNKTTQSWYIRYEATHKILDLDLKIYCLKWQKWFDPQIVCCSFYVHFNYHCQSILGQMWILHHSRGIKTGFHPLP